MSSPSKIVRLTGSHTDAARRETLDLALRSLPGELRQSFVESLLTSAKLDDEILAELWRAEDSTDGRLQGAVWSQLRPGSVAIVWPPQWQAGEPPASPDLLLSSLLQSLAGRRITMAQSLLPDRESADAAALVGCGFEHLAELTYLAIASTAVSPRVDEAVSFAPIAETDLARLANVVDRTYVETLDCPSLNGLRPARDVLDEYRALGDRGLDLWRFVCRDTHEVGCLLLADHGTLDQVEVVYMGIVPEARGHRLGEATVGEALRIAASVGRSRVVLAVDAANRPAIDVYQRCGFVSWETRSVFVKRLFPSQTN